MIDSSASISLANFENMRNALDEMANVFQFTIGRTVQIGLLQYFHQARFVSINGSREYETENICICIEILNGVKNLMNLSDYHKCRFETIDWQLVAWYLGVPKHVDILVVPCAH